MEAMTAMDFNALSRRELQALCKLNGVRANMTNLAMVEALQFLPSVDGIDQIGTTLCLPTPGKSAMKSVLRAAAAVGEDQQQQGSPLPRGRRVSVKSPEAIRMDIEDGEDEVKRDLIKEIVRTPGVALRSTNRRPRATPAPIPTPAAGTLRRSQRSTARKATAPVEDEVATTKRSTRKTAKLNMVIDFNQEEDDAVARGEEKAQEVELKGVASDVKCDDPEEKEVTKLLEANSKEDESEQGEEVVSSVTPIESADKSCDNSKVEEAVEEPTKLQEGAAIGEEQKLVNAEESVMEDSPIFGALSKVAPDTAMKNIENASAEDCEGFGNWSPVLEIADEINNASEDKEDAAFEVPKEAIKEDATSPVLEIADEINNAIEDKEDAAFQVPKEAIKEDATSPTFEAADVPNRIVPAAVKEKEVAADELPQADPTDDESAEEYDLDGECSDEADLTEESSEEDDLDEDEDGSEDKEDVFDSTVEVASAPTKMIPAAVTEKEVTDDELPHADPTEDASVEEYDLDGEVSDDADLTEESSEEDDFEEDMENANLTVDGELSDEADLTEESSEEGDFEEEDDMENANLTVDGDSDETIEASNSTDVNFDSDEEEELKMLETGEEIKEHEESDFLTEEEDDFSADLASDSVDDFSDAETESNRSNAAAPSSAAKTVDSTITEEMVSSEGDEVSQHVETIVESLDKVTITEEKKEECAKEKQQLKVGEGMSLRKLKSAYKESLIAAKEGKKLTIDANEGTRVVLAELDDNAEC
uniref:Uncharacterized protein n=1 Tax=Avena sativa TaxID=4498 RepID=A0ACD5Z2N1_AVESA